MEKALGLKHGSSYYNQELFAKAAIYTIFQSSESFEQLFLTKNSLIKKNPHNIVLHNSIDFFLSGLTRHNLKKDALKNRQKTIKQLEFIKKQTAKIGSKKIKPGSTVFIHSLNTQLLDILSYSADYKDIKITCLKGTFSYLKNKYKQLKKKAKIIEYNHDFLEEAIKKANICLIGGEAITNNGNALAWSKSNLVCDNANSLNIPVYVCSHSWKLDHYNKTRQILSHNKLSNLFEIIPKNKITSYIIEHGIISPKKIINEIFFYNTFV